MSAVSATALDGVMLLLDVRPEVREAASRRRVERGPVSELVKRADGFRLSALRVARPDPIGIRKLDGKPYIEAHHVAPVAERQVGSLSPANVNTVCANHHRQLHCGGVCVEIEGDGFRFALPEREITVPRFRLAVLLHTWHL